MFFLEDRKMMKKLVIVTMLVAVMCWSGVVSAALVAYWDFDSDFTANDPTYDATPFNGASIVVGGKFDGAANFDKIESQYAKTDAAPFTIDGDYSIVAWYFLKVTNMIDGNRYFVFESENYAVSYGLRDISGTDSGQLYTNTSTGTNNVDFAAGGNQEWRHIAITYDASTGVTEAYLDGAFAGTFTQGGTLDPMSYLVIGGHRNGTSRNFHGMIDDVAVFDEVISTDYIGNLASGNPVPEPATLMLLGLGGLSLLRKRRA